jgi:hypothetical protein
MKRFLITLALTCVLCGTALAGDMPGVTPAPAPGATPTSATSSAEAQTNDSAEQLSEGVLSALVTVLGLLAV